MKLTELIEALTDFANDVDDPDGVEVRVAMQPGYPLQSHVADVALVDGTLYLAEGAQVYDAPYLPGNVKEALGW